MVLKIGVGGKFVLACAAILFGSSVVVSTVVAQTNNVAEAPFIGFRPFGGGQSVSASASAGASAVNAQSQSAPRTTITPEQPAPYPYPASGSPAYQGVSSSQTGTAERASLGGRLSSTTTPTGSLNRATNSTIGQTASGQVAGVGNVDPALWQRYQQELQQQQASQQYQQYQQWLAQQEQNRLQRQTSSVGYRTPQSAAAGQANPANNRAAQPTPATRTSTARTTTAKLNQAVVQQVSSTTTSNRDSSVARADWSSAVATKNSSTSSGTSVAKQATSVASSVAKPQCCCVPRNCCVAPTAAPTTPAPVFRPQAVNSFAGQAANQVPTLNPNVGLNPNVASTYGGFLGQAGANYQVQPQGGGYQFQSGLGVPQFQSTGTANRGGWFSNGLFGTGAYTPLLPLVSAQGARLGQGIIGQPTAYMDGQPIRNLLRYLAP